MTILFLDFDGVMHPDGSAKVNQFCHSSILEGLVKALPGLDIVISSTWRSKWPLNALKEYFPPRVVQRIVGVTPLFADVQDRTPERYLAYPRHAECVAWIHDFDPTRAWLAIDDKPYIFQPFCANLVLTNGSIGLTNEIAEAVIRKVSLD